MPINTRTAFIGRSGDACVGHIEQEGLEKAMRQLEQEQTSTCEEKTNAALAIAAIARVAGPHFGEYVGESMQALQTAAVAFQPVIRRAALAATAPCIAASVQAFSQRIRSSPLSQALHASTEGHADAGIVTCLLALEDDEDAATVARACECLGAIAGYAGWPFFRLYLKRLNKRLQKLMAEQALCNRKPDRLSLQTVQDLYGAVATMLCALSRAWAQDVEVQVLGLADADARRHASKQVRLSQDEMLLRDGMVQDNTAREPTPATTWAVVKPALNEWQNVLDQVYVRVLDWAGPHQPEWLRRLAFGVAGSIVREAPTALHEDAMGAFDRYSFPLVPLLNASLAQAAPRKSRNHGAGLEEELTEQQQQQTRAAKQQMLRNCAFCAGIMAAKGGGAVALEALKLHPALLALLEPACPVESVVRDNAVSRCLLLCSTLSWACVLFACELRCCVAHHISYRRELRLATAATDCARALLCVVTSCLWVVDAGCGTGAHNRGEP